MFKGGKNCPDDMSRRNDRIHCSRLIIIIIIIIIIIKLVKAPNSTCSSLLTTNQTNVKKRKREQTEWSTSDLEGDESMTAEHRVCWDVHFFVGECVLG